MDVETILIEQKNKITNIINCFEDYYQYNYLTWDIKELTCAHNILGILILTFKKVENMEKSIKIFRDNDIFEIYMIELEEVKLITEFYYETFVVKKGA